MVGTTQAAFLLGISCQRLRKLLQQGRIVDAVKEGRFWRIPLFNGIPKVLLSTRGINGNWRKQPRQLNTVIHVHRQKIQTDSKNSTHSLGIIVKRGQKQINCQYAVINGPSRIAYLPNCALGCGAKLWIEVLPHVPIKTAVFA